MPHEINLRNGTNKDQCESMWDEEHVLSTSSFHNNVLGEPLQRHWDALGHHCHLTEKDPQVHIFPCLQPNRLLAWHPVVCKSLCHEVQLASPIGHPLQKIKSKPRAKNQAIIKGTKTPWHGKTLKQNVHWHERALRPVCQTTIVFLFTFVQRNAWDRFPTKTIFPTWCPLCQQ